MSLPASPSCRTPVCTNSCPGTGKPSGARPWLHGPALISRSVFEPPGPPGSDLTSRGIRRMGTPGERLRCLFAYLVRERRVSPHHDSRVISRPDLLVYIHQNILVKPRHKILVRQARASSPRAVHAGWKPALPGGPRSLEGGGPRNPALPGGPRSLEGGGPRNPALPGGPRSLEGGGPRNPALPGGITVPRRRRSPESRAPRRASRSLEGGVPGIARAAGGSRSLEGGGPRKPALPGGSRSLRRRSPDRSQPEFCRNQEDTRKPTDEGIDLLVTGAYGCGNSGGVPDLISHPDYVQHSGGTTAFLGSRASFS